MHFLKLGNFSYTIPAPLLAGTRASTRVMEAICREKYFHKSQKNSGSRRNWEPPSWYFCNLFTNWLIYSTLEKKSVIICSWTMILWDTKTLSELWDHKYCLWQSFTNIWSLWAFERVPFHGTHGLVTPVIIHGDGIQGWSRTAELNSVHSLHVSFPL